MKHAARALSLLAVLAGPALLLPVACHRSRAGLAADGSAPSASGSSPSGAWLLRRAGVLPSGVIPHNVPPPDSSGLLPKASREPDWDLDATDAARDYAGRYVVFTKRYDDPPSCIEVEPSKPAGAQRSVEVRTAAGCPDAGKVRDVFLIDVTGDRLTVDDKSTRAPLGRWPDGSDPESPANPVRQIVNMKEWSGPLDAAFRRQLLVPVRVQAYGRGTYPVVSIAAWHGTVQLNATGLELGPAVADFCQGNGGMPLGVMAALDRSHILRVKCPAMVRWDTL